MQDPMMEIAQLVNAEEDLYCLNFHQLQHLVDKEEFLEALSLEFINRYANNIRILEFELFSCQMA